MNPTRLSFLDRLISTADTALRALFAKAHAARDAPKPGLERGNEKGGPLSEEEKRHAAGLMRVNHVGEICAQALYAAQALMAKTDQRRDQFAHAAREEQDHLAWTAERLVQLGGRPSLLNPIWFAGAFGLGLLAGGLGERTSLGFLAETEEQVQTHLAGHLINAPNGLPAKDLASRAIVAQMRLDEAEHGQMAKDAGATEMPHMVKVLMSKAAKAMTIVAYKI